MMSKGFIIGLVSVLIYGMAEASFLSDLLTNGAELNQVNAAPNCSLKADAAYNRVVDLLSDGRQVDAEKFILSALKTHSSDMQLLFAKAVLERSRWSKQSARFWFSKVQTAKGEDYFKQIALLSTQLDKGQMIEKNIEPFFQLVDQHLDDVFIVWLGAIQCRQQTRSNSTVARSQKLPIAKRGKKYYEILLKKFRVGPVMLHHTYANLLTESLREYDLAMKHRELTLFMTSRHWALQGVANTLLDMGEYEKANAVWARLARMRPRDSSYLFSWGITLDKLGRHAEASEKHNKAAELLWTTYPSNSNQNDKNKKDKKTQKNQKKPKRYEVKKAT